MPFIALTSPASSCYNLDRNGHIPSLQRGFVDIPSLTVGVTGHRFLAEVDKVSAGIDRALAHIEATFAPQQWTVLSALADGADQLVTRRLLARHAAQLIVLLPMPLDEYLEDIRSPERFQTLLAQAAGTIPLPGARTHDEAYAALARYLAAHCDLLVAVWDGRPAQGPGGTSEIVARVRAAGKPLAWVHAGNRVPGTEEPTTLGSEQGEVTWERFPVARRSGQR
jgi:hypothetical protein